MSSSSQHRLLSGEILKAFQVSSDPQVQLSRTAQALAGWLGADVCLLYVLEMESGRFLLRGRSGPVSSEGIASNPEEEGRLLETTRAGALQLWASRSGSPCPLPGPSGKGLRSAAVMPVEWRGRPVAVMAVGFRKRARVPEGTAQDMASVSGALAPLVRGSLSRYYQTRMNEIAGVLLRVSERLSALSDVQACLAHIARTGAQLTESSGSVLRIQGENGLKVRAFFAGNLPGTTAIDTPNDLPFAREALEKGRTVQVDAPGLAPGDGGRPVRHNLLCIPFEERGGDRGVLCLFDRKHGEEPLPYTRLERETARALLRVGMNSLYQIGRENEVRRMTTSLQRRVRELTLLHRISRAVIDREDITRLLRSILETVTSVEGYGFDRAFLFLHDPQEQTLRGHLGVASGERLTHDSRDGEAGPQGPRVLDEMISGLTIPVRRDSGILARTVLEQRSFRMRLPSDQDLVGEEVVRHLGNVPSFATVPLLSESRVLGVIWVDNLRSARPIEAEEYQLLKSAAAQAGLAVERSFQAAALEQLNSQLVELRNRLMQWEKMAALGEMAASVAHDIRNPLVSIGGFTRRLRNLLPDDDRGRKYADIIIQEVNRLERTLANVTSYARSYGVVNRSPVSLYGLLSECAGLFRENFRKKQVTLRQDLGRGIPEISLDERQIKQAVINVLFNAGEAAAEHSEVVLSAGARELDRGPGVVISITNQGEGIDPRDLQRIFRPFFTTKGTGTGLGLAIAQRAVSGHGGEIRVDNRHGEGVTFNICLPIAPIPGPGSDG
ncbi:MAG: GAF domain-containing protein [bacterium]|nr:MAG: GAF domain-containing protein [bacterium]